jgi:hypothetical protein
MTRVMPPRRLHRYAWLFIQCPISGQTSVKVFEPMNMPM